MVEQITSQEFTLKSVNETRYYFIQEINQIDLMNKKHKRNYTVLYYIEHLLI